MGETRISSRQLTNIIAIFTIGTTILVTPAVVASKAKHDAWMVTLISIGLGILIIWLYTTIASFYPDKNIFEINEIILGKWFGMISTIIITFIAFISVSQVTWFVGTFLTTQVLADTPLYAVHIIYLAVVVYGVKLGLETLVRSAVIVFPMVIFLFILVIILVSPQSKYENIQPFFEYGAKPIISATILQMSTLCLPLIIFLSIPSAWIGSLANYKKSFFIGYIIGGLIIFTTVLFCILVFGYKITSRVEFPTYLLARKINVLNFFQRLEPIIAGIWIVSIFYRTAFYTYTTLQGLSHIFGLKDHKSIVIPFGILALGLSIIAYPNKAYEYEWNSSTWVSLMLIASLLIPLILLIVGLLKKKKQNSV